MAYDKEYYKRYRETHKEQIAEKNRLWRLNNPDKVKAIRAAIQVLIDFYSNDRDKISTSFDKSDYSAGCRDTYYDVINDLSRLLEGTND